MTVILCTVLKFIQPAMRASHSFTVSHKLSVNDKDHS
jgi:hypothetical protein